MGLISDMSNALIIGADIGQERGETMKAVIHYSGAYEDRIIVEADSIEELRELAFAEVNRRGWEFERCWSEVIE